MKRSTSIVISLVLAAAGAVAYFAFRSEPLKPEQVITSHVKREKIVKKVKGVGHLEPVTQLNISANISGDLVKLTINEGDPVKKGQLLAEIKQQQWLAIVRQQEANTKSMIGQVQLEEANLVQAKADEKRTLALYKDKLTTDAEVERVRATTAVTEARLESARQRVLQAEGALEEAKTRLSQTQIWAPIDGTVISLKKKVGERIRGSDLAEDPLLTLAPLQAMLVRIEVSEQDVVGVKLHQDAEISVDAVQKHIIAGKVIEIAESAIIRNQGLENETTNFQIKVGLDDIPENLRNGMSASVAILTDAHDNALAVPIEAVTARLPSQLEERVEEVEKRKKGSIFTSGKGDDTLEESLRIGIRRERPVEVVFAVEDGKAEPHKVKTGISSETDIEILEGLSEGSEIVVAPYKTLSKTLLPGSPVTIVKVRDAEKPSAEPVARTH